MTLVSNKLTGREFKAVIDLILLARRRKLVEHEDDRAILSGAWLKLTREYMNVDVKDSRDTEREFF